MRPRILSIPKQGLANNFPATYYLDAQTLPNLS
jgi:hypothetical protein